MFVHFIETDKFVQREFQKSKISLSPLCDKIDRATSCAEAFAKEEPQPRNPSTVRSSIRAARFGRFRLDGRRSPQESSASTHFHPMKTPTLFLPRLLALCVTLLAFSAHAEKFKIEPGYISLFNGKDLTGWGYVTNNFDGKKESSDGRYSAKKGILIVHPHDPARGPRLSKLSTTRSFPENFILRLEFRAAYNADSGIFIRGPQLQCRDYLVAGPYKQLKHYKAQDWNEIEIVVRKNVAYCTCNGEILEDALKLPLTGPIGLEADRDQMEYRRIRLKILP